MLNKKPDFKNSIKNDAGFTLLEILAVIVILGILAVVATPKYFNLQAQAREKALAASEAEAISRVNGYFAEQVLGDVLPINIDYTDVNLGFDGDNFGVEFTATVASGGAAGTTDDIIIHIDARAGGVLEGATRRIVTIPRPGF